MNDPEIGDIEAAAARVAPHVRATPLIEPGDLAGELGLRVAFKCESLQDAGAFKSRGAVNAVFSLPEDVARRGVATHSSGNHAAALARAAQRRGIPSFIVIPHTVPRVKRANVERYGGRVIECEPTLAAREAAAQKVVAETGATFVHPYDTPEVIAGQGTIVLELAATTERPDAILVPVGGGGLLSGTALAARHRWPGTRVIGVEPAGADDAYRSFTSGELHKQPDPRTIADGLRGALSARTLRLVRANADSIVTVQEASIVRAMRLLFERLKLVVEPSGAVPLAAILEGSVKAQRAVVVLSGGNVDLDSLPWLAPSAGPAG